jgi:hypothetical protein
MTNDCCDDLQKLQTQFQKLQTQFKLLLQSAGNSNLELGKRNTRVQIKPPRLGQPIKRKSYANRERNRLITNAQLSGGMGKGENYIGPKYKRHT